MNTDWGKNLSDFLINYKRSLIKLGIIVLAGLIIRLVAAPLPPKDLLSDNRTYQAAASDILKGGVISNDIIMPLYPLFLALFGGGEKAQYLIGIITSLISVILTWALARAIFEDEKAGFVAAGIMTAYPMAIFYSVVGLTESLFVTLVLGAFLALYKNRPALASTLFVLSILTRPVMDAFAPFVIFWHTLVVRKAGLSRAFRDLAVYGILYTLIMSPWWYHNAQKFDYFVRLNHGFGIVLYAGNNPMNMSGGGISRIDYDIASVFGDQLPSSIAKVDRILKDTAIEYIRNNPGNFFKIAGVKFVRLWSLIPYTAVVKGNKLALITTLSLLPVIVFAFATLLIRRDLLWHLTPILGFIAYLTLVHMITIGSIRYRYPLEPLLIMIAAPSLLFTWNFVVSKGHLLRNRI
jgi:hypothetical protein